MLGARSNEIEASKRRRAWCGGRMPAVASALLGPAGDLAGCATSLIIIIT